MVKKKVKSEIIFTFPDEEENNFDDRKLLELEMHLNALGDIGFPVVGCKARFHFKSEEPKKIECKLYHHEMKLEDVDCGEESDKMVCPKCGEEMIEEFLNRWTHKSLIK